MDDIHSTIRPCIQVMYMRLSGWSQLPDKNRAKVLLCGALVLFGVVTAVAGAAWCSGVPGRKQWEAAVGGTLSIMLTRRNQKQKMWSLLEAYQ